MIRKVKISVAILATVLFAISLAISIMVLTWIHKLEETACKCSEDFKRDYIKYYFYVYIALYTLMYINAMYVIFSGKIGASNVFVGLMLSIIQYILPVFGLLNMIFSIMYIWRLKEINCKCSEDIRREIYYVLNWINVGFLALGVVMIILSAIIWAAVFAMTMGKSINEFGNAGSPGSLRSVSRRRS
jgi:hypothetical protein